MRNFISGKLVKKMVDDNKRSVFYITLEDVPLNVGEYMCYTPTDAKMIIIEPIESFQMKMDKFLSKIREKINEADVKDEKEKRKRLAEIGHLEEEYRFQMSSAFSFTNKGYDTMVIEAPRNCALFLGLGSKDNDEITAITYDENSLFLINPDDEWRYDSYGDIYSKRDFIQILRDAI